jgi:hypothetical protein
LSTFRKLNLCLKRLDLFPTLEHVLLLLGKVDRHDAMENAPIPLGDLQTERKKAVESSLKIVEDLLARFGEYSVLQWRR